MIELVRPTEKPTGIVHWFSVFNDSLLCNQVWKPESIVFNRNQSRNLKKKMWDPNSFESDDPAGPTDCLVLPSFCSYRFRISIDRKIDSRTGSTVWATSWSFCWAARCGTATINKSTPPGPATSANATRGWRSATWNCATITKTCSVIDSENPSSYSEHSPKVYEQLFKFYFTKPDDHLGAARQSPVFTLSQYWLQST